MTTAFTTGTIAPLGSKVWFAPKVTLLSKPQFFEPAHMPVNWIGDATEGERLVEFAGRMCYMSQRNPVGRDNAAYIDNVLGAAHGSVVEHANYSLLFEGVSRTLTHELIRHRAGMAYSELSQRYVNMEDAAFVLPPAFVGNTQLQTQFEGNCRNALLDYEQATDALVETFKADGRYATDATLRRKRAREAARCLLPNSTETKIVATGNARAWRHVLTMRGNVAADLEIHRLAIAAHAVLVEAAPNLFGDFTRDAEGSLVPKFAKA